MNQKRRCIIVCLVMIFIMLLCIKTHDKSQGDIKNISPQISIKINQYAAISNKANNEMDSGENIKTEDYEKIFEQAEQYFIQIARNPDKIDEYSDFMVDLYGSVKTTENYYLNANEYYDSAEIIPVKVYQQEDGCVIEFCARVYASDNAETVGIVNPEANLFGNREDVVCELHFTGSFYMPDQKFYIEFVFPRDRSALLSAAELKGLDKTHMPDILPAGLVIEEMLTYERPIAEMLMRLVQEPDSIREYEAVFTEESILTVEDFGWYYKNPSEVYNFVQIGESEQEDRKRYTIHGIILVGNDYYFCSEKTEDVNKEVEEKLLSDEEFLNDLPGIEKAYLNFRMEYDVETGVLWIKEIWYENDYHIIEEWAKGFEFTYSYNNDGKLEYHVVEK